MVIFSKICSIYFDNNTVNKLVLFQFVAFLGWALAHMIKIAAIFYVNPGFNYVTYIAPLASHSDKPVDLYKSSSTFWVSSFACCIENIFLVLALSIKLYEWIEIESLVAIQRQHQHEVLDI